LLDEAPDPAGRLLSAVTVDLGQSPATFSAIRHPADALRIEAPRLWIAHLGSADHGPGCLALREAPTQGALALEASNAEPKALA